MFTYTAKYTVILKIQETPARNKVKDFVRLWKTATDDDENTMADYCWKLKNELFQNSFKSVTEIKY